MLGSGWEALPEVREARLDFWECLGGPPVCSAVVGSPSRKFGRLV